MRRRVNKTCKAVENMVARDGVEPPTPAFSELIVPVFPTTSMVAVGLLNTGKYEKTSESWVIAVGDSKAQVSSIETCEISPCHTSNDYFFPVEALPEILKGCVQETSLDWRLQLAESKWPDGARKALQLTPVF
ncbi:MAG: hypothetical protein LAO23_16135 [Acidobacteriia bacterium]|nr:hypothetical protein [Terriglobia bacterium]